MGCVTFLVCLIIYARQYVYVYGPDASAPKSPIAPITLSAVVVVFVVIMIISRGLPRGTRLASAFIGVSRFRDARHARKVHHGRIACSEEPD